jgi:hypothetical protein
MRVTIEPEHPPQLPLPRVPSDIEAEMPESLPRSLALAFAPLHKRAFGTAVGLALGVVLFASTAMMLLRGQGVAGGNLWLLQNYFYGYRVTWTGSLVGLGWGFAVGFVGGWFFAFCRNFVVAATVFWIRAKAELTQTRDFMDHI